MPDRQIFIAPAADNIAQENLKLTILAPVPRERILAAIADQTTPDIEHLRKTIAWADDFAHGLYLWGAKDIGNNRSTWRSMNTGDWLLMSYDKTFHFVAQVIATFESVPISKAIWKEGPANTSDPDASKPFSLAYILTRPRSISVPLSAEKAHLGKHFQGFTRSVQGRERILSDYGSIDDYIEERFHASALEIPPQPSVEPAPTDQLGDIRTRITREDILAAIQSLRNGEPHSFGRSTFYDLLYEGERFPPKAVVGLAARRALGRPLRPDEFSGGVDSWSFALLNDRGFKIVAKQAPDEDQLLPAWDDLAGHKVWIENTKSSHQHGGPGWEFGTCLWSPAKDAAGGDRYAPMRSIEPFDLVVHINDSVIQGVSRVAESAKEFSTEPPNAADWAGREAYLRVDLENYRDLPNPSPLSRFISENEAAIRDELTTDRPFRYPFVIAAGTQVRTVQGGYVTQCTERLYELLRQMTTEPAPERRYWAYSPGEGARHWDEFQEKGIIAIGWDKFGDLNAYSTQQEIFDLLKQEREEGAPAPSNDARALYEFSKVMKPGDIVAAKMGRTRLIGIGRVTGEYRFEPSREEYKHVRNVEWLWVDTKEFPPGSAPALKALTDVTLYKGLVAFIDECLQGALPKPQPHQIPPFSEAEALELLFFPDERLSKILTALRRKRNVILQGPPGVGKTFASRLLAYALLGQRDDSRCELVQFHQSYSYEDFIQGYRPAESGFRRKTGVFLDFCNRARIDGSRPYVFVIDEINRGNVSKIFGELMMLIEADKRGPKHAIRLTYSDDATERFSIPDNVYLIGLMNTADRSLAMVDYALRRRFAFFDLEPAFDSPKFIAHLSKHQASEGLINHLRASLSAVNQTIAKSNRELGKGFRIGHSYFCLGDKEVATNDWFDSVVEQEVEPLLREYFDQDEDVQRLLEQLAIP